MEYHTAEVLEMSVDIACNMKTTRIIPHHLQLVTHKDNELNKLFTRITIAKGCLIPYIQTVPLSKK